MKYKLARWASIRRRSAGRVIRISRAVRTAGTGHAHGALNAIMPSLPVAPIIEVGVAVDGVDALDKLHRLDVSRRAAGVGTNSQHAQGDKKKRVARHSCNGDTRRLQVA